MKLLTGSEQRMSEDQFVFIFVSLSKGISTVIKRWAFKETKKMLNIGAKLAFISADVDKRKNLTVDKILYWVSINKPLTSFI